MDALQRIDPWKGQQEGIPSKPPIILLYLPENNTHSHRFRGDRSYTIIFHHLPRP